MIDIIDNYNAIEHYFEHQIKSFFINRKLIPFIGSGFTTGCKTRSKTVPGVNATIDLMRQMITQSNPDVTIEALEKQGNDLQKIANYFYRYVPKRERGFFLRDHFTNVQLPEDKKNLINCKWPYIYTLNIDDAIEQNSKFTKIIPYHKLSQQEWTGRVFKLHGDADHEITYDDDPNVIFSKQQYIRSLQENGSILSCFQEDYKYKNIIFIGCSLDNEIDLEFVIEKKEIKDSDNVKVDRIYITTRRPDKLRESDLESFGINKIIVFKNYDDFYDLLFKTLNNLNQNDSEVDISKYKNIEIDTSNKEVLFNKEFLCGTKRTKLTNKSIKLPYFLIERNILQKMMGDYKKNPINAITGRRISGKTFLALDFAKRIKNENIYFFPSDISVEDKDLSMILQTEHSTFIFDTNCLNLDNLSLIINKRFDLKKNGSTVLLIFNSSDRLLLPIVNSVSCQIFEIENKLTHLEVDDLNTNLSKIGLINFKEKSTIIENIYIYKEHYYKEQTDKDIENIAMTLLETDLKILILSATVDRVYSNVYRQLKITSTDIEDSIKKIGGEACIEFEYDLDLIEMHQHSGFKTIVNSKSYVFKLLGKYSEGSTVRANKVSEYMHHIVESLKKDSRFDSLQKNLILFDNLNQIFPKDGGGAIKIIFLIYEKLENLLYRDNHFWIQRAKSILYLKRGDVEALKMALIYAKKPYYEAYNLSRLQMQASLLVAMIYTRMAKVSRFEDNSFIVESIEWYYIAMQEPTNNRRNDNDDSGNNYIGFMIEKAKREKKNNDLYCLYEHLIMNKSDSEQEINRKKNYIINTITNWR